MAFLVIDQYDQHSKGRYATVYQDEANQHGGTRTTIKTYYQHIEGDFYIEKAWALVQYLNGGDGKLPPRELVEDGFFPDLMQEGARAADRLEALRNVAELIDQAVDWDMSLMDTEDMNRKYRNQVSNIIQTAWIAIYKSGGMDFMHGDAATSADVVQRARELGI